MPDDSVMGAAYNEEGRVIGRDLGNGLARAYDTYDWPSSSQDAGFEKGGRLHTLMTTGQAQFQNLDYDYDPGGNITQIVDTFPDPDETVNYTYDLTGRLASDSLNGVNTYGYDPTNPITGNLTQKGAVTLTYDAPVNHRVTSSTGGRTYGYDLVGNITSRTIGGVTYTLTYDGENRMISYVGGTVNAVFTYDGDGKRVKGVVNGVTTTYVSTTTRWKVRQCGSTTTPEGSSRRCG